MAQTRQQLLALCLGCTDCIGVYGYDDFLYCKSEKGNLIYYTGRYWYQSSYPMENFLSISSKTKFNTTEELEMWMRRRMWELG